MWSMACPFVKMCFALAAQEHPRVLERTPNWKTKNALYILREPCTESSRGIDKCTDLATKNSFGGSTQSRVFLTSISAFSKVLLINHTAELATRSQDHLQER